jgi:beta-glucanase (GH16 family)/regulation of enolase protein 1 (concanavalin A-like superfamily)
MKRNRAIECNGRRRSRRFIAEPLELRLLLAANLVFNDDFNQSLGSQPNTATWFYNTGNDPNNTNVQYTDTASTLQVVNDPAATDGRALALTLSQDPSNSAKFLSARINTKIDPIAGNFQYGHVEARIKLPGGPNGQGVGIWPAFWMLGTNIGTVGWPNCGEVDIMENKGSTPSQIQGTIHGPGYSGGGGITAYYNLPTGQSFYSGYHTFAADWAPNSVSFSVDGHVYATRTPANLPAGTTWVFNHPFYIILNVADGGAFAGGPGPNSTFPQTMLVDYVRAAATPLTKAPPLTDADMGSPGVAGSSNFDGVAWTVRGGGSDIWNTSDQFHFASQNFSGDFSITARVNTLLDTGDYAKAGIMIRDGTTASASYAFAFVTPNTGAAAQGANFEYRNGTGTSSQSAGSLHAVTAPQWIRLVRAGNSFTAYASPDGVTWTQIGSPQTIAMAASVRAGLAVSANNNAALNVAIFTHVGILPAGWSDVDINAPGAAGSASFDLSTGTWTVSGGGADIWNAADQFHFARQTLIGNGSVVARVTAVANTNAWAKAGVMLRSDDIPGSPFANVDATPGNGVTFQWRSSPGAAAASVTIAGLAAPLWVKVARYGNTFTGYYSADGVTWTQIGTSKTIVMNSTALAGLAVCAHDNAALNGATFTNVAIRPAAVVGRWLFYNNSAYDGSDPAPGPADDGAIDPTKLPLLPGQPATPANYSGYSKGINGVMVDLTGVANRALLSAADFTFKVGRSPDPSTWLAAPSPAMMGRSAPDGSDRVELIWPDGAIADEWLQITVKANTNTGLPAPDVFYFGNLIGDTANDAAGPAAIVSAADLATLRIAAGMPTTVATSADVNKDGVVDAADTGIVRPRLTHSLPFLTAPAGAAATPAVAAAVQVNRRTMVRRAASGWLKDRSWPFADAAAILR